MVLYNLLHNHLKAHTDANAHLYVLLFSFCFVLFFVSNEKILQYLFNYSIYAKYSDRQPCANGADPDQMPHNAASDQSLHCL